MRFRCPLLFVSFFGYSPYSVQSTPFSTCTLLPITTSTVPGCATRFPIEHPKLFIELLYIRSFIREAWTLDEHPTATPVGFATLFPVRQVSWCALVAVTNGRHISMGICTYILVRHRNGGFLVCCARTALVCCQCYSVWVALRHTVCKQELR